MKGRAWLFHMLGGFQGYRSWIFIFLFLFYYFIFFARLLALRGKLNLKGFLKT